MRLNNDCIREILLYIEEHTDYECCFVDVDNIVDHLNYDKNTIYYHIKMISQAKLVDNVLFADMRPYEVSNLSWNGHQYLDNIRDNKVWSMIKEHTNKLSSVSLQILISLAPKIIEKYLLNS